MNWTYALAALDPAEPGPQAALANCFVIFLRFLSAYVKYASKNPQKMPRTWLKNVSPAKLAA